MLVLIIVSAFLFSAIHCNPADPPKNETAEQASLRQFFAKYCGEKDDAMLKKLETCEKSQPVELQEIEDACVKQVRDKRGKTGKATYKELRDIECDNDMGSEFDKCENEQMDKRQKELLTKYPKIHEIAEKIMFCGYDLYGIKHGVKKA